MPVKSEHVKSFLTRLLSFFKFAKGKGFDSDYLFLLCARFSLFVCLFVYQTWVQKYELVHVHYCTAYMSV